MRHLGLRFVGEVSLRWFLVFWALAACGSKNGDSTGRHHPVGYYDFTVHGRDAKLQSEVCIDCHGADLRGRHVGRRVRGVPHGRMEVRLSLLPRRHGQRDGRATPRHPRHDEAERAQFPGTHGARRAARIRSVRLHDLPREADRLSVAGARLLRRHDVGSGGGRRRARAQPERNVRRPHLRQPLLPRNGQDDDGAVARTDDLEGCDGCHADWKSGWSAMSGHHQRHMLEGFDCSDCHADTVNAATRCRPRAARRRHAGDRHGAGVEWTSGKCTGTCHSEATTTARGDAVERRRRVDLRKSIREASPCGSCCGWRWRVPSRKSYLLALRATSNEVCTPAGRCVTPCIPACTADATCNADGVCVTSGASMKTTGAPPDSGRGEALRRATTEGQRCLACVGPC